MRFPDQTLIGDLNDAIFAITSGSVTTTLPESSINENETAYDLLPVIINRPPDIVSSIAEASIPQILPFSVVNNSGQNMYLHTDGNVKVNLGANFTLKVDARQPRILNVENGIPVLIEPLAALTYNWRKDGQALSPLSNDSLRSSLQISGSSIIFQNVQPEHAGTYTCDATNDIGTTTSEPISIEVFNLDIDSFFYRNLIVNPYGLDGVNGWQTNNDDLTTKQFTIVSSKELTRPNRVDLFGYNVDTMHPRPYQIDMGIIKGFDMSNHFLGNKPSYFTRTRYKFERRGGNFLVRAYQDIDLADISSIIKGGVYGISGVRAIFSCYIGNAISQFIPVLETLRTRDQRNPASYKLNRSRISVENFLQAGPCNGNLESVYVTLEEFDNEARVPSAILQQDGQVQQQSNRITMLDPWSKRMTRYWGQTYYNIDNLNVGELSKGDARDATLFTADELYPDQRFRFTYGQYAEFNKVILNRLNSNTTKIRITINFETKDLRIFDQWREAYEASDEIFSVASWEQPFVRNKWTQPAGSADTTVYKRLKDIEGADKSITQILSSAEDPRGMVTGLNLTLIPILSQQIEATEYYTNITLALNNRPAATIVSGLSL